LEGDPGERSQAIGGPVNKVTPVGEGGPFKPLTVQIAEGEHHQKELVSPAIRLVPVIKFQVQHTREKERWGMSACSNRDGETDVPIFGE